MITLAGSEVISGEISYCLAGSEQGLLFRSQNGVLRRLRDPKFDHRLGRNFDLLERLRVDAGARFPFLLYQFAKAGQHEFTLLFDRFIGEGRKRIEENTGGLFVRLGRCGQGSLKFSLGHSSRLLYHHELRLFKRIGADEAAESDSRSGLSRTLQTSLTSSGTNVNKAR